PIARTIIFLEEPCPPWTMKPCISTFSPVPTGRRVDTLPTKPGVAVGVAVAVGVGVGPGLTVTLKVHWEVLPDESDAVLVTVVVPIGNVEPEGGFDVGLTPGQLSLTVGSGKVTTALFCPASACL